MDPRRLELQRPLPSVRLPLASRIGQHQPPRLQADRHRDLLANRRSDALEANQRAQGPAVAPRARADREEQQRDARARKGAAVLGDSRKYFQLELSYT